MKFEALDVVHESAKFPEFCQTLHKMNARRILFPAPIFI